MKLKDVLKIREIEDLKVISGFKGKDEVITNINIMDNPDTVKWLQKGELLLTTGYLLKDDNELQKSLIKDLSEKGCSGLGIKLKRYIDDLPKSMLEQSKLYNFPIIAIPYNYSLSHISNLIYKEIYNKQRELLEKSIEIHKTLTQLSLQGGGLDAICSELVKIVSNPVMMIDDMGRLLCFKEKQGTFFPIERYLNINKNEKVFTQSLIDNLPSNIHSYKKAIKKEYLLGGKKIAVRIRPIAGVGTLLGYIIIWETGKKLIELDYMAMEHSATIASLEIIKRKEIEATKYSIRRDFFDDLLEERITSEKVIEHLSEIHGLYLNRKSVAVVIKINNYEIVNDKSIFQNKNTLSSIRNTIDKVSNALAIKENKNLVSIHRGNQVILFIQLDRINNSKYSKDISKKFMEKVYDNLKRNIHDINISIGIGKLYNRLIKLGDSFKEAIEALDIAEKLNYKGSLFQYEDFMIYNLLSSIENKSELERFYRNTIYRLYEYDKENNSNLIETLEAYFKYNNNISEASKGTFVHRNTFIYRMDKIKSILNTDFKDQNELLEMQLGLKAMKLLNI